MTEFLFHTVLLIFVAAYGKVFLVRKRGGNDHGTLYAMKVLKKASIVQKKKTAEHTMTERQVLEAVRQSPFLVTLYYAFQTDAKLHLILGQFYTLDLYFHHLVLNSPIKVYYTISRNCHQIRWHEFDSSVQICKWVSGPMMERVALSLPPSTFSFTIFTFQLLAIERVDLPYRY